ncbi:MAG: glycosyltransferase family 9 protein [Chthoniobacteraceae bacterium]
MKPAPTNPKPPTGHPKILVLQLKRIGDTILTAPALAALRQRYPEAKITLVVADSSRELLPAFSTVTDSLVYLRGGNNSKLWWQLIFSSYDICLDFTGTDRSALFSLLSKAEQRLTFSWVKKSPARRLFYNRFVESSVHERHTVDHYLDLLGGLNIPFAPGPVQLDLPEWTRKKCHQLLEARHLGGSFALIHPGTARPEKYWLPERWAEVITRLERDYALPCVITGGNDQFEQDHLAAIRKAMPANLPPPLDLSGRIDLLTLAALTSQARVVLSVDSAPMHLAAAFGTPQVALFGKTNPFHWRPRHERAFVIASGHPHPLAEFSPRMSGGSMGGITAQSVIEAVEKTMSFTF